MHGPSDSDGPSEKSRTVALALAVTIGVFGAHRFYAGKTNTALLMLITLGGLGLWWLYDVILIAAGGFRDDEGRLISDWDPSSSSLYNRNQVPEVVLDELEALRSEVAELAERLDFTERLLTRPQNQDVDRGS
ncbi:MAG TPA: TM2 domain-containing protein [Gemmatimonadales bacterium]|nr:TM2 domain-containing protein [Gemmatimonadales bacterium]